MTTQDGGGILPGAGAGADGSTDDASAEARAEWAGRDALTLLNTDIPRVDGPEKVTGRAKYTHDMRLPEMVWAKLVVCPWPRATIEALDVTAARAVPGVVYAEAYKQVGDELTYQGYDGIVAAVAAETPEALEDGVRAVVTGYSRNNPPLVTREQSLADGAPQIGRGDVNMRVESSTGDREETAAALETCDAVIEATYTLPVQHHVCLETHGTVVDYRGGTEATVYHSSQNVTGGARDFARHLELDSENVRVICQHMGGGFGAKFGAGEEGRVACVIARALERPVHLMLDRRQEFLMAGNRSGSRQVMRGGASKDGKLVALSVDAEKFGGMGPGSLPRPPYIYDVGTSFAEVRQVHTATDPNRAQRAPGHPQASFAMECMVDELAYAIGMDPVSFRKANLSDEVWHRQLDRVAAEVDWAGHPNKTTPGQPGADGMAEGIGFGVAVWGSGSRPSTVCDVRIAPDGAISGSTAVQDLGTGSRTLVAAIVAEEFGLGVTDVTAHIGDGKLPPAVYSGGSITTGSIASAIKDGAYQARVLLEPSVAAALGTEPGHLIWLDGRVYVDHALGRSLSWKQACATLAQPILGTGRWQEHLTGRGVHGAQSAKVRVDTVTGRIQVLKMVYIQDMGLPFNRLASRSQINGGMIGALSYGLHEVRVLDEDTGLMLTDGLGDYRIAGPQEIPELVALIDDEDTRQEAMGFAEAPIIPGHGAIANAVFNACGARLRDLPLTPDKVLAALAG